MRLFLQSISIAIVAACGMATGSASAATVPLGLLAAPGVYAISDSVTPSDTFPFTYQTEFDFTITHDSTLTADVQQHPVFPSIFDAVRLTLFDAFDLTGFHQVASASGTTSALFSFNVETGHLYALVVSVDTVGISGSPTGYTGNLTFTTATVAATPIPPALLMFGTALAAMGGLGYRRRKASDRTA